MSSQTRHVLSILAAVVVAGRLILPDSALAGVHEPMPATVPEAPPPIPDLPDAGPMTPPSSLIADPITPEATCGSWAQLVPRFPATHLPARARAASSFIGTTDNRGGWHGRKIVGTNLANPGERDWRGVVAAHASR